MAGGGGGDDTTTSQTNTPQIPNRAEELAYSGENFSNLNFQGAKFGSVYEAGSFGFSPVTEVFTQFDGDTIDLTVRRSDGSRMFLDGSIRTVYGVNLEDYSFDLSDDAFWYGFSYFQDSLMNVSLYSGGGGRIQNASLRVHHNNEDFSDYASFGYWLDWDITPSNPVRRLELGLIADGPDFEDPASIPFTGTALYSGDFIGMFGYANQDLLRLGDYEGSLDLFVNLGNNTISGCIGCDRSVITYLTEVNDSEIREYRDRPTDYLLILYPTILKSNGQWIGNRLTVQAAGRAITTTDSEWAGRMSSRNNDDGLPYESIGTAWVEWREANGIGIAGGSFMAAVDKLQAAINQGPGYLTPGQSQDSPINPQELANSFISPGGALGDALGQAIGQQQVTAFSSAPGITFTLNGDSFVGTTPGADLAASLDSFMAAADWGPVHEQWQFSLKPLHLASKHGASLERGKSLFHLASPRGWAASFHTQGLEIAYQPAKGPFTFTAGAVHEPDSLLGTQAKGIFGSLAAHTFHLGSRWQIDVGQWSLAASGELGLVTPTVTGSRVIDGIDTLTTNAFTLEAAREFNNGNTLRFSLNQPLRVAAGSMDYTLAAGSQDRRVTGESYSASLAPSGRQLDFTTALDVPLGEGELSMGFTMSTEAGHRKGADPGLAVFTGYEARW
ncbi:MAG: hypothetical protein F4158_01505 [Synechococcus sp. SB0675_bin_7]|nr:hypothetical protein [Synechococcus sp. SB0675_bin_7]